MIERLPRILIVDDDPINIRILAAILRHHGDCIFATSGKQALEATIASQPDMILTDIEMPEMDGYELCRLLKEDEATRDIPVVFVTSRDQIADEERGLLMGAVDYISKPISPPILRTRVTNLITLARLQQRFEALRWQDGLTSLSKRPHFETKVRQQFSRGKRTGDPIAILIAELDHFKRYNEDYGHMAGDRALQAVGQCMRDLMEPVGAMVCRYSADDFGVLLSGQAATIAQRHADQIRQAVAALRLPSEGGLPITHVTVSVGVVSTLPSAVESEAELLELAEAALAWAKASGRNRVASHSDVGVQAAAS